MSGAHLRKVSRLLLGAATVNNWSDHKSAIPERRAPRPRSRPLRRSCVRPWLVTSQICIRRDILAGMFATVLFAVFLVVVAAVPLWSLRHRNLMSAGDRASITCWLKLVERLGNLLVR